MHAAALLKGRTVICWSETQTPEMVQQGLSLIRGDFPPCVFPVVDGVHCCSGKQLRFPTGFMQIGKGEGHGLRFRSVAIPLEKVCPGGVGRPGLTVMLRRNAFRSKLNIKKQARFDTVPFILGILPHHGRGRSGLQGNRARQNIWQARERMVL
jgi:hypothetical protein